MSHASNKSLLAVLTTGILCLFAGFVSAASPAQIHAAETVAPAGTVVIGDFEGKTVSSKQYGELVINHGHEFGWGWSVTTDQRMGGHSMASIALIHPGAEGAHGALRVTGEIKPGFPYGPWAGAIWFPGREPMQPGDLSAKKELVFWARGATGQYSIMLQAGASPVPLYTSFITTPQWKEYHILLATRFPNADLKQVHFIAFTAGNPGKFQFDLAQVTLH